MTQIPRPPRQGHPGKPPRRKGQGDENGDSAAKRTAKKPHSYGQSAPMPEQDEQKKADRSQYDLDHESLEDLAGEPFREEGEDEER